MTAKIGRQISSVEVANAAAMSELARSVDNAKSSEVVSANQRKMMDRINNLADQNAAIMRKFEERDNRVSYP